MTKTKKKSKAVTRATTAILRDYEKRRNLNVTNRYLLKAGLLLQDDLFLREFEEKKQLFGKQFFLIKSLPEKRLKTRSRSNPLIGLSYPSNFNSSKAIDIKGEIEIKHMFLDGYKIQWTEFCEKWGIKPEWNGKEHTLAKHLRPFVEILFDEAHTKGWKKIRITIDAWSTKADISARWHEIEKIQNDIRLGLTSIRGDFSRNLCWYYLKNKAGMTISEISHLWQKRYADDIKLMVLKKMRKSKDAIIRDSLKEIKNQTDPNLMRMIKADTLPENVQQNLEFEFDVYIGKDLPGKSAFEDLIDEDIKSVGDKMAISLRFPPQQKPFHTTVIS